MRGGTIVGTVRLDGRRREVVILGILFAWVIAGITIQTVLHAFDLRPFVSAVPSILVASVLALAVYTDAEDYPTHHRYVLAVATLVVPPFALYYLWSSRRTSGLS